MSIDRRTFLKYGAGGAVLGTSVGRAVAQPLRKIRYSVSWVPEGSNLFSFVAKNKGFWRKRGLDVDIARGYGSGAVVQALAAGKFDFVLAATTAVVQQSARGLPLTSIAQCTYKSTMGVNIPADSPIRKPKDLEGKVIGTVPTSGEYPFFPVFAANAGIDEKTIKFVQTTPEVRYRLLMTKQFDAMTGFAISTIPALVSQGFPIRVMLYANYGMSIYELSLVAQNQLVQSDPELCQAFVDGALEAIAYTYLNPAESADIFMHEVKEAGMTTAGRENARLGLGVFAYSGLVDEIRQHGLGWAEPKRIAELNDLVAKYLSAKDAPKPQLEQVFTNRFAGRIRLSDAQWSQALKSREEFLRFFE
jgi:ABC-type nitrate/sulfonate/bicarbonate transport system substrate-binding protein